MAHGRGVPRAVIDRTPHRPLPSWPDTFLKGLMHDGRVAGLSRFKETASGGTLPVSSRKGVQSHGRDGPREDTLSFGGASRQVPFANPQVIDEWSKGARRLVAVHADAARRSTRVENAAWENADLAGIVVAYFQAAPDPVSYGPAAPACSVVGDLSDTRVR
jgi:hypothetical protein